MRVTSCRGSQSPWPSFFRGSGGSLGSHFFALMHFAVVDRERPAQAFGSLAPDWVPAGVLPRGHGGNRVRPLSCRHTAWSS